MLDLLAFSNRDSQMRLFILNVAIPLLIGLSLLALLAAAIPASVLCLLLAVAGIWIVILKSK